MITKGSGQLTSATYRMLEIAQAREGKVGRLHLVDVRMQAGMEPVLDQACARHKIYFGLVPVSGHRSAYLEWKHWVCKAQRWARTRRKALIPPPGAAVAEAAE